MEILSGFEVRGLNPFSVCLDVCAHSCFSFHGHCYSIVVDFPIKLRIGSRKRAVVAQRLGLDQHDTPFTT